MGFTATRTGMIYQNYSVSNIAQKTTSLAWSIWQDFLTNGFTLVDSNTVVSHNDTETNGLNASTTVVIMAPTSAIDPLISTNPWVVAFYIPTSSLTVGSGTYTNTGLYFAVGSPIQIPNVATLVATTPNWYPLVPAVNPYTIKQPRLWSGRPYTYTLTIVQRGFALNIWDQINTETFVTQSTVVVQRGVSCAGSMATTTNQPLFLVTNVYPTNGVQLNGFDSVYNYGGGTLLWSAPAPTPAMTAPGPQNIWFYQVVREADTLDTFPNYENLDSPGSIAFLERTGNWGIVLPGDQSDYQLQISNSISDPNQRSRTCMYRFPTRWQSPVTADTGEYLLVFPFGLCTSRFVYTDELDLIAVSKADAYQANQIVPITVFGTNREYTALCSNNTEWGAASGVRVFILTSGGGI
jgi:hypothetical protein